MVYSSSHDGAKAREIVMNLGELNELSKSATRTFQSAIDAERAAESVLQKAREARSAAEVTHLALGKAMADYYRTHKEQT